MTPKEKAQELVDKMTFETHSFNAKHCALVAVDEILIALEEHQWQNINVIEHYLEVKKELENL